MAELLTTADLELAVDDAIDLCRVTSRNHLVAQAAFGDDHWHTQAALATHTNAAAIARQARAALRTAEETS